MVRRNFDLSIKDKPVTMRSVTKMTFMSQNDMFVTRFQCHNDMSNCHNSNSSTGTSVINNRLL